MSLSAAIITVIAATPQSHGEGPNTLLDVKVTCYLIS